MHSLRQLFWLAGLSLGMHLAAGVAMDDVDAAPSAEATFSSHWASFVAGTHFPGSPCTVTQGINPTSPEGLAAKNDLGGLADCSPGTPRCGDPIRLVERCLLAAHHHARLTLHAAGVRLQI